MLSLININRKIEKIKTTVLSLKELKKQQKTSLFQTYYPEYNSRRKSIEVIKKEQKKYVLAYSRPNDYYFLYGFDIEGFRDTNQYIDYLTIFRSTRDRLNKSPNSPYVVLRDKLLFGVVAEGLGINTPHNIALIDKLSVFNIFENSKPLGFIKLDDLTRVFNNIDAFCKLVDGECANGVFSLKINDGTVFLDGKPSSIYELEKIVKGKRFIIQNRIEQHNLLSAIYPRSINTIRLVTVYNKINDEIEAFSAVLRVGTGENRVDNWAAGGLSIGINIEKGVLRKYGFYKPGFGTKTERHPDSGVQFENYVLPFFKEAIDMAKRFHYYLKGIHSVGWDIAITPQGPCFIEGNDNWEISLMQACNGGLKEQFNRLFIN